MSDKTKLSNEYIHLLMLALNIFKKNMLAR